ncbi:hypothetical protein BKA93DRAFT_826745 [Sparassis latifolia]
MVGSASPLTTVSIDAYYFTKVTQWPKILALKLAKLSRNMAKRYLMSKLLAMMVSANLPKSTPVTVIALDRGSCHYQLFREAKGLLVSRPSPHTRLIAARPYTPGDILQTQRQRRERRGLLTAQGNVERELSDEIWATVEVLQQIDPKVIQIVKQYLLDPAS